MRKWKILNRGDVPLKAVTIAYSCPHCDEDATLPVLGLAIAQTAGGVVFDTGPHAMPTAIQCPYCRHQFEAA